MNGANNESDGSALMTNANPAPLPLQAEIQTAQAAFKVLKGGLPQLKRLTAKADMLYVVNLLFLDCPSTARLAGPLSARC